MKLETFNNDMNLTNPELLQPYNRALETVASVTAEREALKAELDEIKAVLKWASENMTWCEAHPEDVPSYWRVMHKAKAGFCLRTAPTLYDALLGAWKAREK